MGERDGRHRSAGRGDDSSPFSELLRNIGPGGSPAAAEADGLSEALAAQGLDSDTAAQLVRAAPPETLRTLGNVLAALKRERDETLELAKQLRDDLQSAEVELRRIEKENAELAHEREQNVLETLSQKSGRAEEQVRHTENLSKLRKEHEEELSALRRAHAKELTESGSDHGTAVRALEQEATTARAERLRLQEELRRTELTLSDVQSRLAEGEKRLRDAQHASEAQQSEARTAQARLLDEKAQAIAALKSEWEGRVDRLRREQGDALSALRQQHTEEMAALYKAHEDALASRDSEQYSTLRKASEERWARMQQTQEEMRQQHEARVADMETEHIAARELAEREHQAALELLETKLLSQMAQGVAAVKTEWEGKVERLRREQSQAMTLLDEDHKKELAAFQRSQEEALARRDREHQALMRRASEETSAMRTKMQRGQDEAEQRFETKLAEIHARHAEVLKRAEHEQEKLRRAHQQALAALREEQERAPSVAAPRPAAAASAPTAPPPPVAAPPIAAPPPLVATPPPSVAAPAPRPPVPVPPPPAPAPAPAVPAPVPVAAKEPERPKVSPHPIPPTPSMNAVPPRVDERRATRVPMASSTHAGTSSRPIPPRPSMTAVPPPQDERRATRVPVAPVAPVLSAAAKEAAIGESAAGDSLPISVPRSGLKLPPLPVLIGGAAALLLLIVIVVGVALSRRGGTDSATDTSNPGEAPTLPPPAPPTRAPLSEPGAASSVDTAGAPAEGGDVAAPATGSADILSTPSGAAVAVGGSQVGFTPLRNLEIRVGAYPVLIVKKDHQTWSGTLAVEAGKKAEINVALVPSGGAAPPAPTAVASRAPEPTPRTVYLENEVDTAPRQSAGAAVAFPPNVPGPGPGQSLSVTVSFVVTPEGGVSEVQVLGSGGSALDAAVTATISKWKFTAGVKQGAKVPVRLSRKFTFRG